MSEPAVIVEQQGHVLVVTLNRPEKRNAVNSEVMCRLYDAWMRLDADDDLRRSRLLLLPWPSVKAPRQPAMR